jgi:uncharacterized hydantoinase/oxoprolinase family protein
MEAGELVYTGASRTPICALLGDRVAAEFFATTHDAYLLLEEVAEDAANRQTADGRPATVEYAHARLARMRCSDTSTFSRDDARIFAREVRARQLSILKHAWEQVAQRQPRPPRVAISAGSGEFLARRLLDELGVRAVSLGDEIGPDASSAACAHALAILAQEWHAREATP